MEMIIDELREEKDLKDAIMLVFKQFIDREKPFYVGHEFSYARQSLLGYDVFKPNELKHYVDYLKVKVFAVYSGSSMIAVSAIALEDGKVLFLSTPKTAEETEAGRLLIERMVEELENAPDKRLNILAFVGQEKLLASLGFTRINPSIFKFFGVKFIAMRYDFAQIDSEI